MRGLPDLSDQDQAVEGCEVLDQSCAVEAAAGMETQGSLARGRRPRSGQVTGRCRRRLQSTTHTAAHGAQRDSGGRRCQEEAAF